MAARCSACGSTNQMELAAEINFHFPFREGPSEVFLFGFPKMAVCLECGVLVSRLSDTELGQLRQGVASSAKSGS